MRVYLICFLTGMMCLGCNRTEESRPKGADNNHKQLEFAMENFHDLSTLPDSNFSHVVTAKTEYYTTGPQQGRPPDGTFPTGMKVNIVENSGSYVLVRSEGGVEGMENSADSSGIEDDHNQTNE